MLHVLLTIHILYFVCIVMGHPKTYRKLRKDIEDDTDIYLDKILKFIIKYLEWNFDTTYKMNLRKLDSDSFGNYHPIDRLAGELEGVCKDEKGNEFNVHIINFNWNKIVDMSNAEFVMNFIFCLVHEILEIYKKQTGISYVHLSNENKMTDKEREICMSVLENVLKIPKNEFDNYQWKF